jgi:acetyl-CoA carboxylase biotin carboxyl carrier protein
MASKRTTRRSNGGNAATGGAFTLQEVKALVDAIEGTDVTGLVWARAGHKVVIRRGQAGPVATHAVAQAVPAPPPLVHAAPPPAAAPAAAKPDKPEKPGTQVTSPFVGTFYRASAPDAQPYVEVGTRVKKGQVLCIVEAMKLMNEIESEVEGVVAEILVANATPVEFGQTLFRIEPG